MATNKRTYPNTYFAWYNDEDRLAIVCEDTTATSGERTKEKYDSFQGDGNLSGNLTASSTAAGAFVDFTSASHGLSNGDRIKIADNSIIFRCDQDGYGSDHSYPRAAVHKGNGVVEPDPAHNTWLPVSNVTNHTFTVRVVDETPSTNTTTHVFQNANPNGITKAGESVRIAKDSLTFTCSMDDYVSPHSYPRGTDPVYETSISIGATTNNTITLDVGVSTSVN